MTDYEDLAFKPKMTWEDLIRWIKKNPQYDLILSKDGDYITGLKHDVILDLFQNGEIWIDDAVLARNRSYEQMKTIIENLYGE